MITDWHTLHNYGPNLDNTKDVYTFNSDLNSVVRVLVDKLKELDITANYQMSSITTTVYTTDAKITSLELENMQLKKIITKIVEKDFPELLIEFPQLLKLDER